MSNFSRYIFVETLIFHETLTTRILNSNLVKKLIDLNETFVYLLIIDSLHRWKKIFLPFDSSLQTSKRILRDRICGMNQYASRSTITANCLLLDIVKTFYQSACIDPNLLGCFFFSKLLKIRSSRDYIADSLILNRKVVDQS